MTSSSSLRRLARGSPRAAGSSSSASAAASISSSESSTSRAASPSGTNESLLATRARRPRVARVEELGDDPLPHAARPAGLVDDERAAGGRGLAEHLVHRQRRQPAQVDHRDADAALAQPPRDAEREVQPVRPRDDRQVVAAAVRVRGADRARARRPGTPSQSSSPSSWRSRVWYSAIGSRKTQTLPSAFAAATHVRSIAAASAGRAGEAIDEARDVPQDADPVVVVEMAAEPLLVAVALDPHDHPVAVRALREELERRRLAAQLVLGVVEVCEVLDLGDRDEARDRRRRARARGSSSRRAACRRRGRDRSAPGARA